MDALEFVYKRWCCRWEETVIIKQFNTIIKTATKLSNTFNHKKQQESHLHHYQASRFYHLHKPPLQTTSLKSQWSPPRTTLRRSGPPSSSTPRSTTDLSTLLLPPTTLNQLRLLLELLLPRLSTRPHRVHEPLMRRTETFHRSLEMEKSSGFGR